MRATALGLWLEWSPHVQLLRVAERLLGLQPGEGSLALRMVHSLVHITERSLISDIPDNNLLSPEDLHIYFHHEDKIRFHHKSFIDYLLYPSLSLEYCVDMEQMHTRLALASMATSLQPVAKIACNMFPSRSIFNFSISHLKCSYLGVCDNLLGSLP